MPEAYSGSDLSTGDLWWQFLLYTFVLLAVVLLCWWVTRVIARRGVELQQSQSRYLSVLDRLQLAPQRTLYLVSLAGKLFLVGQGEKEINLLAEIPQEDLIRYLEENPLQELDSTGMTFLRNLQETLIKMKRTSP